jgi:hypothetical protein
VIDYVATKVLLDGRERIFPTTTSPIKPALQPEACRSFCNKKLGEIRTTLSSMNVIEHPPSGWSELLNELGGALGIRQRYTCTRDYEFTDGRLTLVETLAS